MHLAAQMDNSELIAKLLQNGEDINQRDYLDITPLHYAAALGNFNLTSFLIKNGADINAKSKISGLTPLMATSYSDYYWNKEVAIILLDKGAKINDQDTEGNTALHISIIWYNLPIFTLLIERGADVSIKNNNGETPLDCAIKHANDLQAIDVSRKFYRDHIFVDILKYETFIDKPKFYIILAFFLLFLGYILYRKKTAF
jgi:ankyrin repeat protein